MRDMQAIQSFTTINEGVFTDVVDLQDLFTSHVGELANLEDPFFLQGVDCLQRKTDIGEVEFADCFQLLGALFIV